MNRATFQRRTMSIALEVVKLTDRLPRSRTADVLGRQLLRSGTSVGANYRAACRARSDREMYAKLAIVEEEADESVYWLELLMASGHISDEVAKPLVSELDEIIAMVVASKKTLARKQAASGPQRKRQADAGRHENRSSGAAQSTIDGRQW